MTVRVREGREIEWRRQREREIEREIERDILREKEGIIMNRVRKDNKRAIDFSS